MRSTNDDALSGMEPPFLASREDEGVSRRTFLKVGLGGALLVAIGGKWLPLSQALDEVKSDYALIIDLNKCTGCGACMGACNQRNNLPEGKSFIRRIRKEEQPEGGCWCLPVQCQHCQDAPCGSRDQQTGCWYMMLPLAQCRTGT